MTETNSFQNKISDYRSILMGVAMLSIMLSHQRFVHCFPFNVFEAFGHWGVDIFLFLSGMGMVRSLESHSIRQFYGRRFLRLIPLCVFCGTLKYIAYLIVGEPIENLKVGLNLGVWSIFSLDLWFIHSIIIYYLLTPFYYWLLKNYPLFTMLVVYVLSIVFQLFFSQQVGFNWLNPIGIMLYTIERMPVFLIGMLVTMYYDRITRKTFIYSGICLFVVVCIAVLFKLGTIPSIMNVWIYPLLSLGILTLVASLMSVFMMTHKYVINGLNYVGKHSLEIYLVHEFIFGTFLLTTYTRYNHFLLLIFVFVLSFAIAELCRRCVDRIMIFIHWPL